ncbi:SDR family NAD(P)-dependent oxidoreductase [Cyanobium sp. NIES-981]|uniref:SDR family NAD(P)-dependent oxidoreductase n=1 Tax=Cyanobium sp. NIES-981 TaxID=1851505 RepID=UPI0007DDA116|nr:SDR family NAD(P)-dependent oxidoreductase [Cyanobium sp. NIES-981]SBO42125.1 Short-chain dehydrogenase/reductase (SDR) superfamily protein [Cyanobium sp. NIES-981]
MPQRHILLTGGSSGIGFEAAARLLQAGHTLTVACRDAATAAGLRSRLSGALRPCILNLADLESVESAAERLLAAGEPIDALVLNAGLQYNGAREPRWSAQGYELTLAVNHLAHQALLQRLLPLLLRGTEPRLVVTASEVHDPTTPGGRVGQPAGLGDLAGLRQGPGAPMLDGHSSFNAEKAYKDTKLCNLVMAREVERRLRQRGLALPVLAWSPGLVIPRGGGGFFRDSRRINPVGQVVFAFVARDLLRLTESPGRAGALLAALAADPVPQGPGFQYWSNRVLGPGRRRFERSEPAEAARDDALAAELWALSAQQLGLPAELALAAT